jgi:hypothetical protein
MGGPMRTNLARRRFGRLKVRCLVRVDSARHAHYLCDCDCGGTIVSRDNRLMSGRTVSCGCWRADPAVRRAAWETRARNALRRR